MSRCFLTPRSLITYTSSSANSSRNSAFSINRSIMPLFKYHSKSGPLCSAIRIRRISGLIRRMSSHSSIPFIVGSVYSAITSSYASGFFWIRSISAVGCAYRSTVFCFSADNPFQLFSDASRETMAILRTCFKRFRLSFSVSDRLWGISRIKVVPASAPLSTRMLPPTDVTIF